MHARICAFSSSSCPGVRWNIMRTDGEPKVHVPPRSMQRVVRVMRAQAERWSSLMAAMSL